MKKTFFPTLILRHRKENLKKCSLHGLEGRSDLRFFTYPTDSLPPLDQCLLLAVDAPPLSIEDQSMPLLLIDGTWNYAAVMERQLPQTTQWVRRSLPKHLTTAYPRKQTACPDPSRGLASVEALYAAHHLLGYSTEGLLDHYYWKDLFLKANPSIDTYKAF